jgi:peptidyl-prolyl cis-trans isomerase C
MRTLLTICVIGALALGMSACSWEGTEAASDSSALGPTRVAVVNGRPIAESVLRVYALATERKNLEELTPEDRDRLLNDLIGVELLVQEAEKDGLTSSRTLAAQLELQRLQFVARSMATSYLDDNPATDADIQAIYDENLPRLSGQQFRARHILVATREEAESVITQLRDGADFVALALERASGPTGPNGGALDWFTADSMPPPFADAVSAMTAGSYSTEPVQTDFGFHVILLEEVRRQEPPALADIRDELASAAERTRLDAYIKTLRESATISLEP